MKSFKVRFLCLKITLGFFLVQAAFLKGDRVGGTNWEEAKVALRNVYYSYTYTRDQEIKEEVDSQYSYVKEIFHENDPEWLSGLVLAKGRKITLVFGGADSEDVEEFCNRFIGRQMPWGTGVALGKVHSGILDHFQGLWPQVYKAVVEYSEITKKDPAKIDFDVIGHSMGAGLAHLAAVRLRTGLLYKTIPPRALFLDLPQYDEESRPSLIKTITFGGLRILDQVAAWDYKHRLKLYDTTLRISHVNDWVTNKLPQVFGLAHVGELVVLPDPEGIVDELTEQEAVSHRIASYNVALNQLTRSEYGFKKHLESDDDSFVANVVGVFGFGATLLVDAILNSNSEGKEQVQAVKEEREKADRLAAMF